MFRFKPESPAWDLAGLAREDATRRARFQNALQRSGAPQPAFGEHPLPRLDLERGFFKTARTTLQHAAAPALLMWRSWASGARRLVRGWPWRRTVQAGTLTVASGAALASVLVVQGYVTHDPAWVTARLQQRLGSGLYDRGGDLIGAMFSPSSTTTTTSIPSTTGLPVDHQAFGYIRLRQPAPALYGRLLLQLEHQFHHGARNVCGTDLLSVFKRVFTGSGGGSALAAQLAKGLAEPEERRSGNGLSAAGQKVRQFGEACAVHRALGGPGGVFDAFVAYAPVAQVNGTTRGPEAGSRVIFGLPLEAASPAQLAVLASLVQRPLALADMAAFATGCAALRAMSDDHARTLSRDKRVARGQCRSLSRARVALHAVLPAGEVLDRALEDIAGWERTGLQPVDSFAAVPARRLVNLSTRAQSLLGGDVVAQIAYEADAGQRPRGEALVLSFRAAEQQGFRQRVAQALQEVDASTAGREQLCVNMTAAAGPRRCKGAPTGFGQAEVLLLRARVGDGGITRLYGSSAAAWQSTRQIGSIAKLVTLAAALQQGASADTLVCPRAASDGGRPLRRDTLHAPHGYRQCTTGQMVTLREATATSDNLAFYELARQLGRERLLAAARALSVPLHEELLQRPAYVLSFGTLLATPAQTLEMGRRLFGLAHSIDVRGAAPQLLAAEAPAASQDAKAAGVALLGTTQQRQTLRELLQAPVSHPRGTLRMLRGGSVQGGKTGTTSSTVLPGPQRRPYQQAKLALTYQPADQTVALSIVAGPAPQPLAQAHMSGVVLAPVRLALLADRNRAATAP